MVKPVIRAILWASVDGGLAGADQCCVGIKSDTDTWWLSTWVYAHLPNEGEKNQN
jgi:hypothetical protein